VSGLICQANQLAGLGNNQENGLAEDRISKIAADLFIVRHSNAALSRTKNSNNEGVRMHFARKFGLTSLVLTGVLLLTACPQQTSVSRINADPARYRNKEVGIVGRVTDSYGVLGNGAYEIDDGTGRLWVVTTRGVPSRGSRVGAKGKVYTGFSFGGRNFGTVLEETDRRVKNR
jgi:hypothetical protein